MNMAKRVAFVTILLTLFVLTAANVDASPVIYLKTGNILPKYTSEGPFRLFSTPGRRKLLHAHTCHTQHAAWGVLKDARQLFVSHLPRLDHPSQQRLIEHIEGCGASVMGYVPDNTLLLVGPPAALEAAANHSLITWAGLHEPSHKVAPEWTPLLAAIDTIMPRAAWQRSNASEASLLAALTALEELPAEVQRQAGQWPLIGMRVSFPVAWKPQPQHHRHPEAGWHAERARRIMLEREGCIAGTAAVEDWAPLLRSVFDDSVAVLSAGPASSVIFAPPHHLKGVLQWVSERPAVRWIEPLSRTLLRNRQASAIVQAGRGAPLGGGGSLDPSVHPFWAAGITGGGQIVGSGDSGIDYNHCFFNDPNVEFASGIIVVGRVRTFDSETHRKIRLYRAIADFTDANGHGTHTAGTLCGIPYGMGVAQAGGTNVGMAPDSKIAFMDLSSGADGEQIKKPFDLKTQYFPFTTKVGAYIHSDSWGSTSITYDSDAKAVDAYCWENPDFLPIFPAGNDGDKRTVVGNSGDTTVNSPATSKNCIAAGATLSTGGQAKLAAFKGKVWTATTDLGYNVATTFRVVQTDFSNGLGTLGTAPLPLAAVTPLQACSPITNAAEIAGTVALVERGDCEYQTKAQIVGAAGAVGVLVFDQIIAASFGALGTDPTVEVIPLATMPRRIGQNLLAVLSTGRRFNISFAPASGPQDGFDNLASFSSQGPVGFDKRIKPDLVAPGMVTSAAAGGGVAGSCGEATFGGTSMATPVIAGSAILVRQYFMEGFYPSGAAVAADAFTPTSALIKAVMVGGAVSIDGYEQDTGLPIDPTPSFRQGFGRVFLGNSLRLANNPSSPKGVALLDAVPINQNDVHQYCITAAGGALSVTLVWTDFPGEPAASRSLVNDLDLVVRAEGLNGKPMLGNTGSVEDSTLPDSVNNIEQVVLPAVAAGRVAVEVRGTNVQASTGAQRYAIVVNGDFAGTLRAPSATGETGQCAVVVATILAGPEGFTNTQDVTFEIGTSSDSASGIAFECKLVDFQGQIGTPGTSDWAPCPSPIVYKALPDGAYTFSVRAQGETIDTSRSFTKDTAPPVVVLSASVPPTTGAATATLSFEVTDISPVATVCRLTGAGLSPQQGELRSGTYVAVPVKLDEPFNCTSPQNLGWTLPGQWRFAVEAKDVGGNAAAPAVFEWTVAVDPAQSYARITSGPFMNIPKREVKFSLVVLGGQGSTECALVPGALAATPPAQWQPCGPEVSYDQPADGQYAFYSRVVGDAAPFTAGAALPSTWAVSNFNVDSTPPVANLTAGPTGGRATSQPSVIFEFSLEEEGSSTTCKLDARDNPKDSIASKPCASPVQLVNLSGGRYTFSVSPSDAVGNVGAPLLAEFIVDLAPPNVTASATLSPDKTAVTVVFEAFDDPAGSGIQNVTCRVRPAVLALSSQAQVDLDDPRYDWQQCSSPYTFSGLLEGHWVVSVVAFDNSDQASQPAELDVWVDTVAPVAVMVAGPPQDSVIAGGRVEFQLSDDTEKSNPGVGSPVQWQGYMTRTGELQAAPPEGQTIVPPSDGGDGGGTSTADVRTAPAAALKRDSTSVASAVSVRSEYAIAAEVEELGQGDLDKWANCSAAVCVYSGLGGGSYQFQSRGVDASGNVGPASEPYAFQLEGAAAFKLPTWAWAAIIGGGVLFVVLAASFVWSCCCSRRRRVNAANAMPPTAHSGGYPTSGSPYPPQAYSSGYHTSSPQMNGQYVPPGAYNNGYGNGNSAYTGYNSLYAPNGAAGMRGAPLVPPPPPNLTASRSLSSNRQPAVRNDDEELKRAIEASLRESSAARPTAPAAAENDDDAQLRAAIQASLEEDRRRQSQGVLWPNASGGPGSAVETWPPPRSNNRSDFF